MMDVGLMDFMDDQIGLVYVPYDDVTIQRLDIRGRRED